MLSTLSLTKLATKLAELLPDKTFCSSELPSPHPSLINVKTGLPITTVAALKELCEQARFGLDRTTVTDLSVRKTLRAGPDVVSVAWPHLDFAARVAGRELNLNGNVAVELHDVLLYEPGDFFKPHVDTKKHLHHQATMVVDVGLDAESCIGGMLVTPNGVWKSSGPGSFAMWVTNVEHEVTPVLSGQRVVATYKLLVDPATAKANEEKAEVAAHPLVLMLRKRSAEFLTKFEEQKASDAAEDKRNCDRKKEILEKLSDPELLEDEDENSDDLEDELKQLEHTTKEFVALWLIRSYSADAEVGTFSEIPAFNLNGGDRLLYDMLLKAYECTSEEVQVMPLVMDKESCCGDFLENENTNRKRRRDCREYRPRIDVGTDDSSFSTYLSGREHQRCCFVDGEPLKEKAYRGHYTGNDAGDPVYTYHRSYIRVPASRLKKWAELDSVIC